MPILPPKYLPDLPEPPKPEQPMSPDERQEYNQQWYEDVLRKPVIVQGTGTLRPLRYSAWAFYDENLQRMLSERRDVHITKGLEGVADYDVFTDEQGYWDNPLRITRYLKALQSMPPGTQPPEFNIGLLESAYTRLSEVNRGLPLEQWKRLPEDDPLGQALRQLPPPRKEMLLPYEERQLKTIELYSRFPDKSGKAQVERWENMPRWQKWLLSTPLMPQADIPGRPVSSKLIQSGSGAVIAGLGGYGMSILAGGLFGLIVGGPAGAAAGAAIGAKIGTLVGLATAGASMYQSMTNNEVPVLNKALDLMNILAVGAERAIGVGMQTYQQRDKVGEYINDVLSGKHTIGDAWQKLDQMWLAGDAAYSVLTIDAINGFAKALDFLDANTEFFEVDENKLAKDWQIWRISQGYSEPVDARELKRDVEALIWLRENIKNGDFKNRSDILNFVHEFKAQYGDTGVANEFFGQTIVDPANLVGFAGAKVGSKVAKLLGHKRFAMALEATAGNPLIDALPFGVQQLAEFVTGSHGSRGVLSSFEIYRHYVRNNLGEGRMIIPDEIKQFRDNLVKTKNIKEEDIYLDGNRIHWIDPNGEARVHEFENASVQYKAFDPEDLNAFQREMAGLTPEGKFKELEPYNGVGLLARLANLTPASQASIFMDTFHTNMSTLLELAGSDVDRMVKLVNQAGGVDEVVSGDIGQAFLSSPAIRTIQSGLRSALDSGIVDEMYAAYKAVDVIRNNLNKVARALGEDPYKVLQELRENPDVLVRRINEKLPDFQVTKEFLQDHFKPFIDSTVPLTPAEFRTKMMVGLVDKIKEYVEKRYNLKPNPAIERLSQTLKSLQALVLLGFNPAYLVNNAINNIVTRAAEGVGGFTPPWRIEQWFEQFGMTPPRAREGITPLGEAVSAGREFIARTARKGDIIDVTREVTSNITNKIGIFSKLAQKVEQAESLQASYAGTKRYWGQAWRRGKGFRRLPPDIELVLDREAPGLKNVLYNIVESGLNMDAVFKKLGETWKAESAEVVARQIGDESEPAIGVLRDIGAFEELDNMLQGVLRKEDIGEVFSRFQDRVVEKIRRKHVEEISERVRSIENIVKAEGITSALNIYGDLQIDVAQQWISSRMRYAELYDNYSKYSSQQWRDILVSEEAYQDRMWKMVWENQVATFGGIVRALQDKFGSELSGVQNIVDGMNTISRTWNDFFEKRREIFKRLRQTEKQADGESHGEYVERRRKEWSSALEELDMLYDKATKAEMNAQSLMDESFIEAYTGRYGEQNRAIVEDWRKQIRDIRQQMIDWQKRVRRETRNMRPGERIQYYNRFNHEYNVLIAQLKELEANGAFEIFMSNYQTRRANVPEMATRPRETRRVSTVKKQILNLANSYGIPTISESGTLLDRVLLNIINKYISDNDIEGGRIVNLNALKDSDIDTIVKPAFEAHKQREAERQSIAKPRAEKQIETGIARVVGEEVVRNAETERLAGFTREEFERSLRDVFNLSDDEIQTVLKLIDNHAVAVMRKQNPGISREEAARQWYASHIEGVVKDTGDIDYEEFMGNVVRAAVEFKDDGKAVIRAIQQYDIKSVVHEIGHIFRRDLDEGDIDIIARHYGGISGKEFLEQERNYRAGNREVTNKYIEIEEKFAEGFEQYLASGVAPTTALARVFQALREFLRRILGDNIEKLNNELRRVYDNLFTRDVYDFESLKRELGVETSEDVAARILRGYETEQDFLNAVRSGYVSPDGVLYTDANSAMRAYSMWKNGEVSFTFGKTPKQVYGFETTMYDANDTRAVYRARYKIVELDDLIPSHKFNEAGTLVKENIEYPQELQPRTRERAEYNIALLGEINPGLLVAESPNISDGTIIVGKDNIVESGNGRFLRLQSAQIDGRYDNYREFLVQNAAKFGFTADDINRFEYPVLVRERTSGTTSREDFARRANVPAVAKMSATETAIIDSRFVGKLISRLDENAFLSDAVQNPDFSRDFINNLPDADVTQLSHGMQLTVDYVMRAKNAIVAYAYGDTSKKLLDFMSVQSDEALTIRAGIENSAVSVAALEKQIRDGIVKPEFSIVEDVGSVVDFIVNNKRAGRNPMLHVGELPEFQRIIADFFINTRSKNLIADVLRSYSQKVRDDARASVSGDIFGETATKLDLMREVLKSQVYDLQRFEENALQRYMDVAQRSIFDEQKRIEDERVAVKETEPAEETGQVTKTETPFNIGNMFSDFLDKVEDVDVLENTGIVYESFVASKADVVKFSRKLQNAIDNASVELIREVVADAYKAVGAPAPSDLSLGMFPLLEAGVAKILNQGDVRPLTRAPNGDRIIKFVIDSSEYLLKNNEYKNFVSDILDRIAAEEPLDENLQSFANAILSGDAKTAHELYGKKPMVLTESVKIIAESLLNIPGKTGNELTEAFNAYLENIVPEYGGIDRNKKIGYSFGRVKRTIQSYYKKFGDYSRAIAEAVRELERKGDFVNAYIARMYGLPEPRFRAVLGAYVNSGLGGKLDSLMKAFGEVSVKRYRFSDYEVSQYMEMLKKSHKPVVPSMVDVRGEYGIGMRFEDGFPISVHDVAAKGFQFRTMSGFLLSDALARLERFVVEKYGTANPYQVRFERMNQEQKKVAHREQFTSRYKSFVNIYLRDNPVPSEIIPYISNRYLSIPEKFDENVVEFIKDRRKTIAQMVDEAFKPPEYEGVPEQSARASFAMDVVYWMRKGMNPDERPTTNGVLSPFAEAEIKNSVISAYLDMFPSAVSISREEPFIVSLYNAPEVVRTRSIFKHGKKLFCGYVTIGTNKVAAVEYGGKIVSQKFSVDGDTRTVYLLGYDVQDYSNPVFLYEYGGGRKQGGFDVFEMMPNGEMRLISTTTRESRALDKRMAMFAKLVEKIRGQEQKPVVLMESVNPDVLGYAPVGGTPDVLPTGRMLSETLRDTNSVLSRMREHYENMFDQYRSAGIFDRIGDSTKRKNVQDAVYRWLNGRVREDMASVKNAAIGYGQMTRDMSLLNYSRRYGFDPYLELVFPYQFWYTRTMMNWARRMIDRPSWFAMWSRIQQAQDKLCRDDIPSRLRGKIRLDGAWLPEWAGGGLYIDPYKQIFPFSQFFQPIEQLAINRGIVENEAENIIHEMIDQKEITEADGLEAIQTRSGSVWEKAVNRASIELDRDVSPASLATTMITPSLFWTIPSNIIKGHPEKIGVLPITKTGQTIRELGRDTFAEPATNLIGDLLAKPEEYTRSKFGLSEFGEWGDYYIDRMLSNMAAERPELTDQIRKAMIDREGELFEEAKKRVQFELSLKTPGATFIQAIKNGAKPGYLFYTLLTTIYPGGLYPEGELKQRGLKTEFDNAWKMLEAGDENALEKFFERHPEYEARLALYDEPEERLHRFLENQIWDGWYKLDRAGKSSVVKQLGDEFRLFLNSDKRDRMTFDTAQLAEWAHLLGGLTPKEYEEQLSQEPLKMYDAGLSAKITEYMNQRDSMFPEYYALQEMYYALPQGYQRKAFLAKYPRLREYWNWKAQYKKAHPELAEYFDELKNSNPSSVEDSLNDIDIGLLADVLAYKGGKKLSSGAEEELKRIYTKYGKSSGLTYQQWLTTITNALAGF